MKINLVKFGSEVRNVFTICSSHHTSEPKTADEEGPANFETAAAATGFGKYNFFLLSMIMFPSIVANTFATTTSAFIAPIAECDLDLSLSNKGLLNGITYLGMITSGLLWGYLSDTVGRKKLLVIGYLCNGFVVLLSGFSQHYLMLVILKFLEGFIINGPFAALVSYMNEFHCAKYRSFIPGIHSISNSIGSIMLPTLAWLILTKPITISIIPDEIVLRSWNVFLLICSIPSLTAGLLVMLFPESPKFQMTIGKNKAAYKTFQTIYSWNTGNSPDKYPIKTLALENELVDSEKDRHKSKTEIIKDEWKQLQSLFQMQYVSKLMLVVAIDFFIMMGLNTLRLWLPQLFAAITNYQLLHKESNGEGASLCQMLEILHPNTNDTNETCNVNYNLGTAYMNNILVSLICIVCFLIAIGVTGVLGKRITMACSAIIGGICGICIYVAHSSTAVVVLSSICIGLTSVAASTILSIVVDIFPTKLRTITLALTLIVGRIGAMIGNVIFPNLLENGCFLTFATIGCLSIGGAILTFALPKTDTKELE